MPPTSTPGAETPETGEKLDFRFVAVFGVEDRISSICIYYDQVKLAAR